MNMREKEVDNHYLGRSARNLSSWAALPLLTFKEQPCQCLMIIDTIQNFLLLLLLFFFALCVLLCVFLFQSLALSQLFVEPTFYWLRSIFKHASFKASSCNLSIWQFNAQPILLSNWIWIVGINNPLKFRLAHGHANNYSRWQKGDRATSQIRPVIFVQTWVTSKTVSLSSGSFFWTCMPQQWKLLFNLKLT